MKVSLKSYFLLIIGLLFTLSVPAQTLKSLPADPSVKTGEFPDGIHYYVIPDASSGNRADYLLVQRKGKSDADSLAAVGGTLLGGSSFFPASSIQKFMLRNSVAYGPDGFVSRKSDSNIYAFRNVGEGGALQDSVLLALFDLVKRSPEISPDDQALIVSGNVDAGKMIEKARILSHMVPAHRSGQTVPEYQWTPTDTAQFRFASELVGEDLFYVSVTYSSPRLPQKDIATVLPIVSGQMTRELGEIVKSRLERQLKEQHIPVAEVSVDVRESVSGPSDESFTISVYTSENYIGESCRNMVSVLSDVGAGRISEEEYTVAHNICLFDWYRTIKETESNHSRARKCAESFLYGSSLASDKEGLHYIASKVFDPSRRLELFKNYARKFIDKDRNVVVETSSGLDLREIYYDAWSGHVPTPADTVSQWGTSFLEQRGVKSKVSMKKSEPLSKGRFWTFSNGVRVVYVQKPTEGRMYYKMVMNGGLSYDADMKRGQGAFYSDLFFTGDFNGVDGDRFQRILNANGMTMVPEAGTSRFVLSGSAPSHDLDLMAGALLTATGHWTPDPEAYSYYVECEKMKMKSHRVSRLARMSDIDSLLFPANRYSLYKSEHVLDSNLIRKAASFYEDHFRKINDGILVLVGDREEKEVLEVLVHYFGRLRTNPVVSYKSKRLAQPLSGTSTYTLSGDYQTFDIVMTSPLPFTSTNHAIFNLALLAMGDEMSGALDGTGMYADVEGIFFISPQERAGVMISSEETAPGSLEENIPSSIYEVVSRMRTVMEKLCNDLLPEEKLKHYKDELKDLVRLEMAAPEYWLEAVSLRYCNGKDITTNYGKRVDSVTADQVRSLIRSLNDGGMIEYINSIE